MIKAMIVSLGGSPQPVIVAISHYQPEYVCFVASEQSVELVPEVRRGVSHPFEDGKALVSDVNDLLACYGAAIQAADRVEAQGYRSDEIAVDYTGGTKSMTGSLVLASVARGFAFSYVGGDVRTKGGLGQVVDGSERLFEVLNPWEVLAVQEQARLAGFFNQHQFAAAAELLQAVQTKARQDARLGRVFASLSELVAGYAAWDHFAHRGAAPHLRTGARSISDCALLLAEEGLQAFSAEVQASLTFFNRMSQASHGFQRLCREMVMDLIANGERRASEAKYDDAVARLYRALEMAAQVALGDREPPIQTGAVPVEAVPDELRAEFAIRYAGPEEGLLRLPLYASYRLLAALGDPLGERFVRAGDAIRGLLSARNGSILAHGLTPLDKRAYESLLAALLEILGLDRQELPRFPQLSLRLYLSP